MGHHISSQCQAGNANTTLYVDLWNQVESKLLPNITEYLWTSPHTTQSLLRNVLKARYGQLWNMNMAYVRKMPYMRGLRTATSNACPLCSLLEDSGSHLLGGCRHRDMVKSYIARHNEAGRSSRQSQREHVATMCSLLTLAHKKTCKQWELLIRVCLLGWLKRPPSQRCVKTEKKEIGQQTHLVSPPQRTGSK